MDKIIKDYLCYSVEKRIQGKKEQKQGNQLVCDMVVAQGRDDSSYNSGRGNRDGERGCVERPFKDKTGRSYPQML